MSFDCDLWLETDSIIKYSSVTIGLTSQQIFPRDPMRFAFTAAQDTSGTIFINIGTNTTNTPMFAIAAGAGMPTLTRKQIGDLICEPINCWISAGSSTAILSTVSYNPKRWAIYNEYIRKYLRDYGAV